MNSLETKLADVTAERLETKLADVTAERDELLKALKELTEHIGDCYEGDEDEVGECAVCHEISYKPHAEWCAKRKAKELIAKLETR